jgi:hypothetical protein
VSVVFCATPNSDYCFLLTGSLLILVFDLEDWDSKSLQNVGELADYTPLRLRQYSPKSTFEDDILIFINVLTYYTHLHLVPRSRMVELYFHFTLCLHGVVIN